MGVILVNAEPIFRRLVGWNNCGIWKMEGGVANEKGFTTQA
jgi:hypothetical protein